MLTEKDFETLPCPTIFKDFFGTLWRVHCLAEEPSDPENFNLTENPYYVLFECDDKGNYDPEFDYAEEFCLNEINQDLKAIA